MLVLEETEILPITAARAGEPDAWRMLFERFRLPLFSYIRQLTGDDDLTLDLIQETFLNASRYIASLHSDDKFSPWLFGIARQKVVQTWRKKRVSTISLDDEAQAETIHEGTIDSPADQLVFAEKEGQFWSALQALSIVHREVIVLFFLEEFSMEQIAEITETSLGTVKSRLFYARKNFKEIYERE